MGPPRQPEKAARCGTRLQVPTCGPSVAGRRGGQAGFERGRAGREAWEWALRAERAAALDGPSVGKVGSRPRVELGPRVTRSENGQSERGARGRVAGVRVQADRARVVLACAAL